MHTYGVSIQIANLKFANTNWDSFTKVSLYTVLYTVLL